MNRLLGLLFYLIKVAKNGPGVITYVLWRDVITTENKLT